MCTLFCFVSSLSHLRQWLFSCTLLRKVWNNNLIYLFPCTNQCHSLHTKVSRRIYNRDLKIYLSQEETEKRSWKPLYSHLIAFIWPLSRHSPCTTRQNTYHDGGGFGQNWFPMVIWQESDHLAQEKHLSLQKSTHLVILKEGMRVFRVHIKINLILKYQQACLIIKERSQSSEN